MHWFVLGIRRLCVLAMRVDRVGAGLVYGGMWGCGLRSVSTGLLAVSDSVVYITLWGYFNFYLHWLSGGSFRGKLALSQVL